MTMNPTSVHLLIVAHDWAPLSGKYCIGQATRFLSDVKVGQKRSVSVCSSAMKLPTNPESDGRTGLGTAFRACVLPFAGREGGSCRAILRQLYMYGDELDAYEADGLVTYLGCAFSRNQEHKVCI
ncbi:hypothetical protein V7S43_004886 [Phytophthora oleae]|uniref:Uncharacterized protein n=1 Tax=Phytophthora oleae TaxID=2107226 RepID=A0ABD3FWH1_9STRA